MGNDQKPRYLSYMIIETHNFKILSFLLHGNHTPQLKNIAIPAIAFLLTRQLEYFWVSNLTYFFGDRQKLCVNYNYYYW